MQQLGLILDSQEEADRAIDLLWNTLGVRGEIFVIPMDDKIKLDVISEQDLSIAQLDKLPGRRTS